MFNMSDRIKRKARAAIMRLTVATALSAGMTGAAAQNVQNNDKNNDLSEQGFKTRRAEMPVPPILGEKPIELSRDQLWEMVNKAGLNESQMDAFIEKYAKLVNSPQGLTDLNFAWMMDNSAAEGIFSEKQASILKNKAVEYNLPVKAPDEKIIEDGVRSGEEHFKVSGTFVNNVESNTQSGEQGNFLYYNFDKNGKLHAQYNGIVNLQKLMPPLVQQKDGSYRCGAATGLERARVISQEKALLRNVVVENMVYQDLQQKKANGLSLGDNEQNFMKNHLRELSHHGLSMGAKGLQKTDLIQVQQSMQMQR